MPHLGVVGTTHLVGADGQVSLHRGHEQRGAAAHRQPLELRALPRAQKLPVPRRVVHVPIPREVPELQHLSTSPRNGEGT
eukprot:2203474-Rhodomonas_salina.1